MIETSRLMLRPWLPGDLKPFAAVNCDPKVMEFLPRMLSESETEVFIEKTNQKIEEHGFGLFACVLKETAETMGFVGLNVPNFKAHFTPCIEVGWRLGSRYWGKGYATEAAKTVLEKAFTDYGLNEVVSFTVPQNSKSRRVMEKLGMTYDANDDFQHPALESSHHLSKHVLYRIRKEAAC